MPQGDPARLLGAYILPGRVDDPRPGMDQAAQGEALGLGSIWLSERWDTKEAGTVCGALSQVTQRASIVLGATHFGTRHPLVLAGLATTMQALSGGRFVIVIARSAGGVLLGRYGIPTPTNRVLIDNASILRRLWEGDTVDYDGPAGHYEGLRLADAPDRQPPPLLLTALGPKTLALAGRYYDGVVLHPFLTLDGVRRVCELVRNAAVDAGRDPTAITIYGTIIVAPDLPPDEQEAVVGGRAVTYFQSPEIAKGLAAANKWSPSVFDALLAYPQFSAPGSADQEFRREQLVEASRLIPAELLASGAAIGTAAQCAARLQAFIDAGADQLCLHGATPDQCGPVVEEFRTVMSAPSTANPTERT